MASTRGRNPSSAPRSVPAFERNCLKGSAGKMEVRVELIGMKQSGSNNKVANSLVALSSAPVLAASAASRFEAQTAERRVAVPGSPRTGSPIAELRPATPSARTGAPAPALSASSNATRHAAGEPSPIAPAEPVPTKADVPDGAAAPAPVEPPAPSSAAAPAAAPGGRQAPPTTA